MIGDPQDERIQSENADFGGLRFAEHRSEQRPEPDRSGEAQAPAAPPPRAEWPAAEARAIGAAAPSRTGKTAGLLVPLPGSPASRPGLEWTGVPASPEEWLRQGGKRARRGWQASVHNLTGGRVSPSPGRLELELERLEAEVRTASTARPFSTVSTSPKGGVGKTTTAVAVGTVLGRLRSPEPVLLVETNPHLGTSQFRLRISNPLSIYDLVGWMDEIVRAGGREDGISSNQLEAFLSSIPERNLKVLSAPSEAHLREAMTREDLRRVLRLLCRHFPTLLLDTGTDILQPSASYVLQSVADQVLIVVNGADGAHHARVLLNRLLQVHGVAWVQQRTIIVLNEVDDRGLLDMNAVRRTFEAHVAAVCGVAWDRHLQPGGQFDPALLSERTRMDFLRLAAAVGRGYALGGSPRVDPWLRPRVS